MANLSTIQKPHLVADRSRNRHLQLNIETNWNPDAEMKDQRRLQNLTETYDLNKEKLKGPKTDSLVPSIRSTQIP